jgi:hypothetical protein
LLFLSLQPNLFVTVIDCALGGKKRPGSDLLSHAVTSIVPSALMGLTSLFGMGRGVAPSVKPPGIQLKLQTPSSKFQTNHKFQYYKQKPIEVLILVLVWFLGFGTWDLIIRGGRGPSRSTD